MKVFSARGTVLAVHLMLFVLVQCGLSEGKDNGIPVKSMIPEAYSIRVEETDSGHRIAKNYIKYYDHKLRKMAIWELAKDNTAETLFDFGENMVVDVRMELKPAKSKCEVEFNLTRSSQRFQSDYVRKPDGTLDISSPAASLLMEGRNKYVSLGPGTIRGIPCNTWSTTMQVDTDETVTANISFTDSTTWKTANSKGQMLVQVSLEGENIPRSVVDYSDFTVVKYDNNENDYANIKHLQPPPGVVCDRGEKRIPVMPEVFKLKIELIVTNTRETMYSLELYDYQTKRAKFEYFTPSGQTITEVHDFVTGVGYKTNSIGECDTYLLTTADPDVRIDTVNGSKTVKMANSRYFYVFNATQFMYEGQRVTRGIVCDVWTATGQMSGKEATWRYFFASEDITEVGVKFETSSWLIMYEMRIPEQQAHMVFNVYEYSERKPDVWDFDIGTCFPGTMQKTVMFQVPVSYTDLIASNEKRFKNAIIETIQGHTGLSALRISDIQIDYTEASVQISASLLSKAPVAHQNKEQYPEPDLAEAYNRTVNALRFNAFEIPLRYGNKQIQTIKASLASSSASTSSSSSSSSSPSSPPSPSSSPSRKKVTSLPTSTPSSAALPRSSSSSGTSSSSSSSTMSSKISASKDTETTFSSGQVAGLSLGMLFIGILLSSISFVLYLRKMPKMKGLLANEEL